MLVLGIREALQPRAGLDGVGGALRLLADVALKTLVSNRVLLAADLCLLELVPFVLGVLLLQGLHGRDDQFQGFVRLLGVIDDKAGVLFLFGTVVHGFTAARLLHLDQFGHVRAEQGINPLGLSVSVYVQLDVRWQAAGAGRTPGGRVCRLLAAEPVAVEVG